MKLQVRGIKEDTLEIECVQVGNSIQVRSWGNNQLKIEFIIWPDGSWTKYSNGFLQDEGGLN